jgi:hypothetical protein
MIIRGHSRAFITIVAVLFLIPAVALAVPVGTFTKVEGNVDILRPREVAPAPVRVGDPVSMGDAVRTKRNAKAEIQFRDESVIQLAPETRIAIDEYTFRGDAREKSLLSLFRGKIRAIVSHIKAVVVPVSGTESGFSVKTPTAIAGVKGSDIVVYHERGVSGVIFRRGFGFVYNPAMPDRVVQLRAGQATFVLGKGQQPLRPRPVSDSFVAPHIRDVTITEGAGGEAGTGTGQPTTGGREIQVDIVRDNTTYGQLTDPTRGGIPEITQPLLVTTAPFSTPPGPPPTLIPPTPTITPVTVNVTIP